MPGATSAITQSIVVRGVSGRAYYILDPEFERCRGCVDKIFTLIRSMAQFSTALKAGKTLALTKRDGQHLPPATVVRNRARGPSEFVRLPPLVLTCLSPGGNYRLPPFPTKNHLPCSVISANGALDRYQVCMYQGRIFPRDRRRYWEGSKMVPHEQQEISGFLNRCHGTHSLSLSTVDKPVGTAVGLETTKWSNIVRVGADDAFLVSCHDCGQHVRYGSQVCPQCGAPWPGLTRALGLIYGMTLLAIGMSVVLIDLIVR